MKLTRGANKFLSFEPNPIAGTFMSWNSSEQRRA
jgi:hypothetical protein